MTPNFDIGSKRSCSASGKANEPLDEEKRKAQWEKDAREAQKRRLKFIQSMCNRHMDSPPKRLQTLDRQILVPYEDLLRIWDACNNIRENL